MNRGSFANILLTGPCNLRCPTCIGRSVGVGARASNLDTFPLAGLDAFAFALVDAGIRQVSFTGLDTEPQLYRHQSELIDWLRRRVPGVQLSLHTNGTRILDDPRLFNRYDRATISVPSFDAETCRAMTGSSQVLDVEAIARVATIPLKVSTLLTPHNVGEIGAIVRRCREAGIRRVVLRKLYGGGSPRVPWLGERRRGELGNNPVYDVDGVELTIWDFARTRLRCLNLLPDGRVVDDYVIARAVSTPLRQAG